MEKEEILMKAQQENKGKDIADLEAQKKGTNIAFTVGGLAFIAIVIVEMVVTGVMHYEIMGGCFLMLATAFFVKYFMLKKKHELFVAICYTLIAIGWLTCWILRLTKVIQYG